MTGDRQPPLLLTRQNVASMLGVEAEKLTWWVWALEERRRYTHFEIQRRNGGTREIAAPIAPIKAIQRDLAELLASWYSPSTHVHGYAAGRSIQTNARPHIRQQWVLKVDLKDFFPTINFGRVRGLFLAHPFEFGADAATLLAQICCHRKALPQGAPTSPIISNLICRSMDKQLAELARRERCYFTRYADDLTFSTDRTAFPATLAFLEGTKAEVGSELETIITSNGFLINQNKTRLVRRWQRQRVTGLVVNRTVNVPRAYIRDIRNLLHIWERHGQDAAEAAYDRAHPAMNRPPGKPPSQFTEQIRGRVQHVGGVKGWQDSVYRHLADRLAGLDSEYAEMRAHHIRRSRAPRRPRARHNSRVDLYICTEGESDVLHLKAAIAHFHRRNEYRELRLRLDGSSAYDSDKKLAAHLRQLPASRPNVATCCLFDRDNPGLLKEVELQNENYSDRGNGAFAAALIAPDYRTEPFCMEFLYSDQDLLSKDPEGRRIYRLGEFDPRTGQHNTEQCNLGEPKNRTLIRDDVFEYGTGKSLALGKVAFAELVAARTEPFVFDFEGFRPTIEMLIDATREVQGKVH